MTRFIKNTLYFVPMNLFLAQLNKKYEEKNLHLFFKKNVLLFPFFSDIAQQDPKNDLFNEKKTTNSIDLHIFLVANTVRRVYLFGTYKQCHL